MLDDEFNCRHCNFTTGIEAVMVGHERKAHGIFISAEPISEKDSIEARAEALASEYFGPEFDGSHLTRKEAFVAGYKVAQQELNRQASDAVEKERAKIADELNRLTCEGAKGFEFKLSQFINQLRGQSK